MLISVIGTHCVGKSTLLKELAKNPNFIVDDFKVSRSVQKELGCNSLEEATNCPEKMIDFQERVLEAKYNNDIKFKSYPENSIIFVERSFLDIIIYAKSWTKLLNLENHSWISSFEKKALYYQKIYDALVLIEPNDEIPFEEDVNRGSIDTRNEFAKIIREKSFSSETPGVLLSNANLQDRIDKVEQLVNCFRRYFK